MLFASGQHACDRKIAWSARLKPWRMEWVMLLAMALVVLGLQEARLDPRPYFSSAFRGGRETGSAFFVLWGPDSVFESQQRFCGWA